MLPASNGEKYVIKALVFCVVLFQSALCFADVNKIVPSGPAAQAVLLSFAPEKVVALSNKLPADAPKFFSQRIRELPVVGQFYGAADLNLEELAKAAPDMMIDLGESKGSVFRDMERLSSKAGISAVHIDAGLKQTPEMFRRLGTLLGKEAEGEAFARRCENIYARAETVFRRAKSEKPKRLLYLLGPKGMNAAAKGGYHAQTVDMAGENVAVMSDMSPRGFGDPVDFERILLWDPDVVLFAPHGAYDEAGRSDVWRQLSAVTNGKYYEIPSSPYNWVSFPPSVNRYLGLIWLPKLLYPEYADYDLYTEVKAFYKMFYRYDLTRAEFDAMMQKAM